MFMLRRVEGLSMTPNYPHGKIVLAIKRKKPKVGDVVIANHHNLEHLKRVSQINDGKLFLLGDNADESTDSRHYGWLPLASVLGVVLGGGGEGANDEIG